MEVRLRRGAQRLPLCIPSRNVRSMHNNMPKIDYVVNLKNIHGINSSETPSISNLDFRQGT